METRREESVKGNRRRRGDKERVRERREGPRVHNPLTDSFVE